jgi:hypothetical protein
MEQPKPLQPLGVLDDILPDIDLSMILTFACHSSSDTSHNLSSSYESLLQNSPWLLGSVHSNIVSSNHHPGTKFLSFPANRTNHGRLCIQDLSRHEHFDGKSYDTLVAEHLPSRYLNNKLLVPGRDTGIYGVKWILRAQVTFIRGGAFLCMCTSHAAMDATGLNMVLDTWARLARGEIDVSPVINSRVTVAELDLHGENDKSRLYEELKREKELWHMLGLDYRPKEMTSTMLAQMIPVRKAETRVFKISSEQLEMLKRTCSREIETGSASTLGRAALKDMFLPSDSNKATETWVSTSDALSALLWRCIMRARVRGSSEQWESTSMQYAINIRHLLPNIVPALQGTSAPKTAANVVVYSINEATMDQLIETSSLADIAKGIRTKIRISQNTNNSQKALLLAATIPDVSSLGLVYPTWLGQDLVISSLLGLNVYTTNWGKAFGPSNGKPDFVRFPEGLFEGITFVMPRQENGDVELVVTMVAQDMDILVEDNEWKHYVQNRRNYVI